MSLFLKLYKGIKKEGLGKQQIVDLLKTPNRLLDLKDRVDLYNDNIWGLLAKKVKLEEEVREKVKDAVNTLTLMVSVVIHCKVTDFASLSLYGSRFLYSTYYLSSLWKISKKS